MIWALLVVGWVVCGVLAYGLTLADFQDRWPVLSYEHRRTDYAFAIVVGTMGPLGLVAAAIALVIGQFSGHPGFYGFRLRLISYEEYIAAHRAKWPNMTPVPPRRRPHDR